MFGFGSSTPQRNIEDLDADELTPQERMMLKRKNLAKYYSMFEDEDSPALTRTHLKGIKEWLEDPKEEIHPMTRANYGYLLRHYGDGKVPTRFSRHYDNYYAPFLAGVNATTRKDMIDPQYLRSTPFDTASQIRHKRRYNVALNKYSAADPFLTAGAGGLGLLAASTGGLPGLIAGHAIQKGIPLAWHLAKQAFAKRSAKKTALQEHYDALRASQDNTF